jgi:hypothetical protein
MVALFTYLLDHKYHACREADVLYKITYIIQNSKHAPPTVVLTSFEHGNGVRLSCYSLTDTLNKRQYTSCIGIPNAPAIKPKPKNSSLKPFASCLYLINHQLRLLLSWVFGVTCFISIKSRSNLKVMQRSPSVKDSHLKKIRVKC